MHMQFQDGSRNIHSCVHNAVVWLIHSAAIKKLEYQDVRTTQNTSNSHNAIECLWSHGQVEVFLVHVNVSTRLTSES